jgi:hypothetical protein
MDGWLAPVLRSGSSIPEREVKVTSVIDERLRHFDRIVFGVALAHHYYPGLVAIAHAGPH